MADSTKNSGAAYEEFEPTLALRPVVSAFWTCITPSAPRSLDALRVLPDGCLDLIARFDHDGSGRLVGSASISVVGPMERFALIDLPPATVWIGVRFRPGAAGTVLRAHPPDLVGRELSARECSPHLESLLDGLGPGAGPSEALSALALRLVPFTIDRDESVLPRTRRAVELLEGANEVGARIRSVASAVGVSERTLHRDVLRSSGLPPKTLARVLRLQRAVTLLRNARRPDLCVTALEAGYADQSHMTKEFSELAGLSPAALLY